MSSQKQRSPKQPNMRPTEQATKLDGLLPYAYLAAIIRSEYVELNGVRHRPTLKQRREAAQRLVAALQGTKEQEDDFYSQVEKGSP